MDRPNKITILTGFNRDFTVLVETVFGDVTIQDGPCFDEMLGHVARLFCPTFDDGKPCRNLGKPLFLSPPEKTAPKHPDAMGEPLLLAGRRHDRAEV
jgi:hypothetical protein